TTRCAGRRTPRRACSPRTGPIRTAASRPATRWAPPTGRRCGRRCGAATGPTATATWCARARRWTATAEGSPARRAAGTALGSAARVGSAQQGAERGGQFGGVRAGQLPVAAAADLGDRLPGGAVGVVAEVEH